MKIALVRGNRLNPFEIQCYSPLCNHFDLVAFTTYDNPFELAEIKTNRLHCFEEIQILFPARFNRYLDYLFKGILEINVPMFGLEKHLAGYDIVHASDISYNFTFQAIQAKQRYGNRVVLTLWENIPFGFGKTPYGRRRKTAILTETDLFLAASERAREAILLEGVAPDKVRVIYAGVDMDRFRPQDRDVGFAREFGIERDDLVILFVGRIIRSKGVFELAYAAKKLLHDPSLRHQRVKFLLVGSGPASAALTQLLKKLGISSQVLLAGPVSYQFMPQVHSLADLFILPSIPTPGWQEQFGLALVESMASGRAVIGTWCGSIPEVIGDAGWLVQPNDHYAIYHALKALLLDHPKRAELGQKARARALHRFDRNLVAERIKQAYCALTAS